MATRPLPVVDPARSEFGFGRTVCACHDCTVYCRHLPGYLVPADLARMRQYLAPDQEPVAWARRHLLASPGALVLRRGRPARIRTLVPARRADGACAFLTEAGRCAVHPVAPFGCAFFDSHQPAAEADRRSRRGLRAVLEAWDARDAYAQLWAALAGAGLVAPAPEVARRRLRRAHDENGPG